MEKIIEVLEKEPEVLFSFLFGSYAKGIQNENSDIEIYFLKNTYMRSN